MATFAFATLPTRFEELRLDNPDAFPVNKFEFRIPETTSPVRVPTDVILGWKGWETTRATFAFATLPTKLLELRFEIAEPFPENKFEFRIPETTSPVRVPSDVTLGWAGWETTRATLALATLPTKLLEFRFEIPEPLETIKSP